MMDIEQLKLIISLLQNVTDGTFYTILTYFGIEAFKAILWFLVPISIGLIAIRLIRETKRNNEAEEEILNIRSILKVYHYKSRKEDTKYYQSLTSSDKMELRVKITELAEKE